MKSTPYPPTDSQHEACEASFVCQSALDKIVRKGAQRVLAHAIEAEVEQYISEHSLPHYWLRNDTKTSSITSQTTRSVFGSMPSKMS